MAEIIRFLDKMDETREIRTQDRPEILQMDGFRSEWSSYMNEWIDNNADWG